MPKQLVSMCAVALCVLVAGAAPVAADEAAQPPGLSAPPDPGLLRSLRNTLLTEGLPMHGLDSVTRAEALHLLSVIHDGDDLMRAVIYSRVRLVMDTAARR